MRLLFHEDSIVGYEPTSPNDDGDSNDGLSVKSGKFRSDKGQRDVSTMVRPRRMLDGRDRLGCTPLHVACVSSPHFRQLKLIKVSRK